MLVEVIFVVMLWYGSENNSDHVKLQFDRILLVLLCVMLYSEWRIAILAAVAVLRLFMIK